MKAWSAVRAFHFLLCYFSSVIHVIGISGRLCWAASSKKVPSSMHRMCRFTSSCAWAKYHALHLYTLKYSMNRLADCDGPDQTVHLHRLSWVFAVRMCQKTPFCMAPPMVGFLPLHNNYAPPTSKKLVGHIASGAFIRLFVHP